jgi:23S rRNA (guanosine2251-2'-O)-methyltransferase
MSEVIYGIHAISEALKRGGRRFDYVAVSRDRTDNRLQPILDLCREQGITLRSVPREDIDRATRTNTHQGVMAVTSRKEYTGIEELLEEKHGDYNSCSCSMPSSTSRKL